MSANLQDAVIRTLSYFQVFEYPLKQEEVHDYLQLPCDENSLKTILCQLVLQGSIFCLDGYYCLVNNPELVRRRENGWTYAQRRLKTARRIAQFLGNFPFVDSVLISGSLSKDFALPDSDLDFFIITKSERMWIARSLMHLFKKVTFLVGAQHLFCMNYYVSTDHKEVLLRNIYTATEMVTLKPAFTGIGLKRFFENNAYWVKGLLPNLHYKCYESRPWSKKIWPTRMAEYCIDKMPAARLDRFLYRLTYKKWVAKWTRKKFEIQKCCESIGYDFNTPVNFPKDYPGDIMRSYECIYMAYKPPCASKKQAAELPA